MEFDKFTSTRRRRQAEAGGRSAASIIPCDTVVLAIGQENAFPWIERDIGIEFDKWDMPVVDKTTFMSTRPGVFFGGDAAFGPENIIWAVEHGHQAAISIHNYCQGMPVTERPPHGMKLDEHEDGAARVGLQQRLRPGRSAQKMKHVDLAERFAKHDDRSGEGLHRGADAREVERCLNCDVQTHFTDSLCIECDACIDICPVDCLTITPNGERGRRCASALHGAGASTRISRCSRSGR